MNQDLDQTTQELEHLEKNVHELLDVLNTLQERRRQLESELNDMKMNENHHDIDPVKRELIRNKVQTMLSALEDL